MRGSGLLVIVVLRGMLSAVTVAEASVIRSTVLEHRVWVQIPPSPPLLRLEPTHGTCIYQVLLATLSAPAIRIKGHFLALSLITPLLSASTP